MRNADYWRGRFSILEDSAHREAQRTIQDMEELYLDAQRLVQKEIESWYARFAVNNQISLTDARKWLTAGQLEEFHWSVEQYIKIGEQAGLDAAWLKKLENASARFHISRLEAVQTGIQQQLELLYGNQVDSLDALLKKVVGNGYTHTAFEVQKGVGLGWDITGLDQKKLETLLSKPWTTDGRTFRDRCWLNKNDLVGSVSKSLTQGLLRGDSPAKIATAIQKQFGVHRYKAGRLVNTETTYFNAVATKECYKDLDVEMVEIIETLDSHTCSICGGLDGKVIPISQYEPGVTVPPFHPNCRGTTAPAIDPKYAGERAARNANGDVYYVPANMKYADWKKAFVDGGAKTGLTLAVAGDIIKSKSQADGGSGVHTVGHIDIETYRCITDDITTDEVIITSERIQHIQERHPGAYEKIKDFLQAALDDPDYILEDKNPNTGLILKAIKENGLRFQMVLRVHTSVDNPGFKNSIISGWDISESRWENYVNNKKILYKRE
jgi:SPP1 gp7 family putative phage head morphogenesis protein|nr:MAG TPA: minor capsid protein [Caudoviricetes sp.]